MLRLSIDDGCASDVKVASLALKYGFDCTFYWPVEWRSLAYANSYTPLTYDQAITIAKQFEVGSHTITHRHLTKLPIDEACIEIAESQQILAEMFDRQITKFCPPRGYSTPELTKFTLDLYDSQRLTRGEGLVHVHPDSGANGNVPWQQYADSIDVEELWMHSYDLDRYSLWAELEDYLAAHS